MTCDVPEVLPDALLDGDGAIALRFRAAGLDTFREACRWVSDLPYGSNAIGGPAGIFNLTAGNCHGKKKDVTDMDLYCRVMPFASDDENCTVYVLAVQYSQRTEPALARISVAEIRRIARACSAKAGQVCAVA